MSARSVSIRPTRKYRIFVLLSVVFGWLLLLRLDVTNTTSKKYSFTNFTSLSLQTSHEFSKQSQTVASVDYRSVDTVLVVMHSDDEVIFASNILTKKRGQVLVVCVTCGQAAAWNTSPGDDLANTPDIRKQNFVDAVSASSNFYEILSFPDRYGEFSQSERQQVTSDVKRCLQTLLEQGNDVKSVITHSPHGEYGHPGHKQCYHIVTDVLDDLLSPPRLKVFCWGNRITSVEEQAKLALWKHHTAQQHVLEVTDVKEWFFHESVCDDKSDSENALWKWVEQDSSSEMWKSNSSAFKDILERDSSPEQVHRAFSSCPDCLPVYGELGQKLLRVVDSNGWKFEDRELLHNTFIPEFARQGYSSVLWVGVFPASVGVQHYFEAASQNVSFFTIEPDPSAAPWGAGERHIVDRLQNITKYSDIIPESSVDLVMLHGVIGWGIDSKSEIQDAAKALSTLMKPGGLVYLWRNTISPGDVKRNETNQGACGSQLALEDFYPYFEPLERDVSKEMPSHKDVDGGSFDILYHACCKKRESKV